MNCQIVSPERKKIYKRVKSISLPTLTGQVQILPRHAEIFTSLQTGEIVLKLQDKKETINIKEGVCYFKDNWCYVVL